MMHFQHRDLVHFVNDRATLEHLCDHVLTAPEACIWYLLFSSSARISLVDEQAIVTYATQLWSDRGPYPPNAQGLYDAYREKLAEAMSESVERGWAWKATDQHDVGCWHGYNRYGIFVVWHDDVVVRTGMVLALVAPEPRPTPSMQDRQKNPLPRKGTWIAPRGWKGSGGAVTPELNDPTTIDRQLEWLYSCFRQGVSKMRGKYDTSWHRGRVQSPPRCVNELEDEITFEQWERMECSATRPAKGVRV